VGLYAEGTTVPTSKSQAEIQRLLVRFGATSFASGFTPSAAAIEFGIGERRYRIMLPLPDPTDRQFTHSSAGTKRYPTDATKRYEAEIRRRWRSLLLIVKSRLEAAATGISTIEEEFAMATVLPDGRTAAEHVLPAIEHAYTTGELLPIMGGLTASVLPELEAANG
jgi:hypothetical protein